MRFFFDMFPVDADEFHVMAVGVNDCRWERIGTYDSKGDAFDAVERAKESGRYRVLGVQPQNKDMYPFQTHALQEVWVLGG